MKKILFLLMVVAGFTSAAQQDGSIEDAAPRLVFNQADFGDRFAVLADDDEAFNYFVADLTKMPTRFQKVYLLNTVFGDREIISIDSDLSKDQLWFKVPDNISEHDALCKFDEIRTEAVKAENSMTEQERQSWLTGHDKFQKVND